MQDIMKASVPDLTGGAQGRYKIQLFDSQTNELVKETEWHNMINPAFGTLGYHLFYLQMPFANTWSANDILSMSNVDGMQSGLCSTLSLVNTEYTPEQYMYGFPDGDTICKTNLFKADSTESAVRANVNLGESYNAVEFDDSGKLVYRRHLVIDYATHQGNGTFNSILISASSLDMFKRLSTSSSSSNNEYYNKPVGAVPAIKINSDNEGTSTTSYSDVGPVSVEAPGIFWTCNSYGHFKKTESSSAQSNNWDALTFYRWDVADGTIKLTNKVKLTGMPEDVLSKLGTTYYLIGWYLKGKFYVESTYTSTPYSHTCYIFDSSGAYEKSISWERTSSSASSVSPGYGSMQYEYAYAIGLPQCIIQCRHYSTTGAGTYLNIFGVDGSPIKQLSRTEFHELVHSMYISAYDSPTTPLTSVHTRYVNFTPLTLSTGKTIAVMTYNGVNNEIGYYDPDTNTFKTFDNKLHWNHDTASSYAYDGMYVHATRSYIPTYYGLVVAGSVPWWSWCKLPQPVTKTSSTTMKVQYDIVMDVVAPFSPAIITK